VWYDGLVGAFLIAIGTLCVVSPRWVLLIDERIRGLSEGEPKVAAIFTKGAFLWAVRISGVGVILLGILWLFLAYHMRQ
jgi:hypothetical protein